MIILCRKAFIESGKLTIENYSVVNGAQSITTFYNSKSKITDDLRVMARIIALQDDDLVRTITENSNNQNAIKPRDLRSNHSLMTRLQNEMVQKTDDYFFEIKRGEVPPQGRAVITNDEVGRALLAFDLGEPWSCHQIYKVFDDRYSDIFGRREVDYRRIILVKDLVEIIEGKRDSIVHKPMAYYALTKFFLLYVLGKVIRKSPASMEYVRDASKIYGSQYYGKFLEVCADIVSGLAIDLNYEVEREGAAFDYKSRLKSPKQSDELALELIRSHEKDVARGKAASFHDWEAGGA